MPDDARGPSPLQNRVLPTGEIVAHPGRGLLMGNRGCLHGPDRQLGTARWRSTLWISCVLNWRGRHRDPMPPGRWTALFFLDEATALAAGHRPCGYCRRADYLSFAQRWQTATGLAQRPRAVQLQNSGPVLSELAARVPLIGRPDHRSVMIVVSVRWRPHVGINVRKQ